MSYTIRDSKSKTQVKGKKRKLDDNTSSEIESLLLIAVSPLKIVSYNVDPSDRYILEDPDVILLQEIVMNNVYLFIDELKKSGYKIAELNHSLPDYSYYTLSFVRNSINITSNKRIGYIGNGISQMMRDMNTLIIEFNNQQLLIINLHLESTAACSQVRTNQLEQNIRQLLSYDGPALICGDLNIRDSEVSIVNSTLGYNSNQLPYSDVWQICGENKSNKITWNSTYFDPAKKYSCRFDRIYINNKSIRACHFKTIGNIKCMEPISTTPSDHYGIVAVFDINKGEFNSNQNSLKSSAVAAFTTISLSSSSVTTSSSSKVTLSKEDMREKRIKAMDSNKLAQHSNTKNYLNETILSNNNNNNNNNINNDTINNNNNIKFKKISTDGNELINRSSIPLLVKKNYEYNNNNNKLIIISDDDEDKEDKEDNLNLICPPSIDPAFFNSLPNDIKLEFIDSLTE